MKLSFDLQMGRLLRQFQKILIIYIESQSQLREDFFLKVLLPAEEIAHHSKYGTPA
jgi:hypothetical protein